LPRTTADAKQTPALSPQNFKFSLNPAATIVYYLGSTSVFSGFLANIFGDSS
jgi:hypothetical protein